MMERNYLLKSLTHRSRFPKGVTKLPLAAEGVTRRWLTEVEKGSNTSQVSNREMNVSESLFKVSKAQLARQNITIETCDGQTRRKFGYWSCVCRYGGGMNRLQAFHRNVGEPQDNYKGIRRIKEASGWRALGIRQKERRVYGVPEAVGQVHSSEESSESCRSEGTWLLQIYTRKTTRKGKIRNECKRRKDSTN